MKTHTDEYKIVGVTHRIFWVFVCVSVLTIVYFNLIDLEDLKRLTSKFPEISKTVKLTF